MIILTVGVLPAWCEPAAYRLGPQDKVQIKVYDWRAGNGEAHEWPALNGEFIIGASGTLSLPLLGDVSAYQKTTAEVSDIIADRLQSKVGLAQRPDASVEVIKYRPFYILGDVDRPGEYDYRPDLTVLQAVSTAGGLSRLSDTSMLGFERDALVSRGDLRSLDVQRIGLLARQARLDAETGGADEVTFPLEVMNREGDALAKRTIREEQLLFAAHKLTDEAQAAALAQSKDLLNRELSSLAAKDASMAHQLDVSRKELQQISGLVSKGIAILPRQLEVERGNAQFESSRLDIELATLRAQQELAKTANDLTEIRNKRRSDALIEAADVRAKLADVTEKIETTQGLVYQAEVRAPAALALSADRRPPVYSLTRTVEGRPENRIVEENDPVRPGDIVRVEIPQPTLGRTKKNEAGGISVGGTPKEASRF